MYANNTLVYTHAHTITHVYVSRPKHQMISALLYANGGTQCQMQLLLSGLTWPTNLERKLKHTIPGHHFWRVTSLKGRIANWVLSIIFLSRKRSCSQRTYAVRFRGSPRSCDARPCWKTLSLTVSHSSHNLLELWATWGLDQPLWQPKHNPPKALPRM